MKTKYLKGLKGLNSVLKMGKNYYPHVFLEEFKYVVKESKMTKFINDEFEITFDETDEKNSDKE